MLLHGLMDDFASLAGYFLVTLLRRFGGFKISLFTLNFPYTSSLDSIVSPQTNKVRSGHTLRPSRSAKEFDFISWVTVEEDAKHSQSSN